MTRILRGDVVWVDLDPTCGHEQGGSHPDLGGEEPIILSGSFVDRW